MPLFDCPLICAWSSRYFQEQFISSLLLESAQQKRQTKHIRTDSAATENHELNQTNMIMSSDLEASTNAVVDISLLSLPAGVNDETIVDLFDGAPAHKSAIVEPRPTSDSLDVSFSQLISSEPVSSASPSSAMVQHLSAQLKATLRQLEEEVGRPVTHLHVCNSLCCSETSTCNP